jgi:hypothetical protein
MSQEQNDLTVIAEAETFLRARDVVSAVRLGLGPEVPVILRTTQEMADDFADSKTQWPLVQLVSATSTASRIVRDAQSNYILVCPPLHVVGLLGASSACRLLDDNPDLYEVGGLIGRQGGEFWSGALCQIGPSHDGSIATAPVENLRPHWKAEGLFSTTPTDFLGGPLIVRRTQLKEHHLRGKTVYSRALSSGGPIQSGRACLFSGFIAITLTDLESVWPRTASMEILGASAYSAWKTAEIREITVLHRGFALRDDGSNTVTFHADNRIAAVDGRGASPPFEPWNYYVDPSTRLQLGPGFGAIWDLVASSDVTRQSRDALGTSQGLSQAELAVIRILRRVASKLPAHYLSIAQRLLKRLEERKR